MFLGSWRMGKTFGLFAVLVSMCILTALVYVPTSHSLTSQPPIDTARFVEGTTAWGPRRADPARAYDSTSGELIFNVYENLIWWNKENYGDFVPVLATNIPTRVETTLTVTNTSILGSDPTNSTWTNALTCVGLNDFNSQILGLSQGDVLYMFDGSSYRTWFVQSFDFIDGTYELTLWRGSYPFHIRTSPVINFINETGATVDVFNVDDAVYAFQRGLVQDQSGSPQWMFYKALFGTMSSDPWDVDNASRMLLANLINSAIEENGDDLIIDVGIQFPDNAFKQILCSTWGGIVSKEFSTSIGCWDGNLLNLNSLGDPDWWNSSYVRRKSRSPYDTTGVYRYVGTGPYYVSVFNQTGNKVVMQRNTAWWQGWPISGNGNAFSTGYVDTYEIDYVADWSARKNVFLASSIDVCTVPTPYMFELLNNNTKEPYLLLDPYMETIKNLQPVLSQEAFHFTFTINSSSPYIGTGSLPNGIPTDFFNNTHCRKAFAYSFNQTQYIDQTFFGEAIRRYTPLFSGLCPDYRNATSGYAANYSLAEAELKQAIFGNQSVWNSGFTLQILYNEGGDQRRISVEMIRGFFQTLSTYDGRVGPAFKVNIGTIDYASYLNYLEDGILPLFHIPLTVDFADADNIMRSYMYSNEYFSYYQNYTLANGWGDKRGSNYPTMNKDELIDLAFVTPDGPERAKMYADLETIYLNDCPSFMIPTQTGRRWCQHWVKGWYHNAACINAYTLTYYAPGTYFPSVYKYDDCWYDVSGPTSSIQDGIVNMRDITYLVVHFNAKASIPGSPSDPKWVDAYGNGCVDPYGDRVCNMRDMTGAILHFGHKNNTLTP
jgi:peptide/nickel transport system substrate-binding protein